jgi:hypothetical protein
MSDAQCTVFLEFIVEMAGAMGLDPRHGTGHVTAMQELLLYYITINEHTTSSAGRRRVLGRGHHVGAVIIQSPTRSIESLVEAVKSITKWQTTLSGFVASLLVIISPCCIEGI